MEETLYYSALYDCYQLLLTEKQQSYFEEYYFYNLSFGEIGENEKISRNAVCKQVKDVCKKLEEYESKLHLCEFKKELNNLMDKIEDKTIKEKLEELEGVLENDNQ